MRRIYDWVQTFSIPFRESIFQQYGSFKYAFRICKEYTASRGAVHEGSSMEAIYSSYIRLPRFSRADWRFIACYIPRNIGCLFIFCLLHDIYGLFMRFCDVIYFALLPLIYHVIFFALLPLIYHVVYFALLPLIYDVIYDVFLPLIYALRIFFWIAAKNPLQAIPCGIAAKNME